MDDWEKYEQMADNPKYRADVEFAMYGATHFGMKAIPILSTAPTYGDKYPEIIKAACDFSFSKGDYNGRTSDIDKDLLDRSGLGTHTILVNKILLNSSDQGTRSTLNKSTSSSIDLVEKKLDAASFQLMKMSTFCEQRIAELKAERLMEKLNSQMKPKSETRQQTMKMKI